MQKGLVYVFTGEGKGKTSAAVGVAIRAVGAGMKVGWVAWYKEASWKLSERKMLKNIGVKFYLMGKGFHIKVGPRVRPLGGSGAVVDKVSEGEHKQAAVAALKRAEILVPKVDVLVLDEVNNAIADGLLKMQEVLRVVEERGMTHMVLTGRDATPEIIKLADLVTEMKKIKHPYDKGKLAVRGLDF